MLFLLLKKSVLLVLLPPALLLLRPKSGFPPWLILGYNKPQTAGRELGLSVVTSSSVVHFSQVTDGFMGLYCTS